jgi:hypothetical protein
VPAAAAAPAPRVIPAARAARTVAQEARQRLKGVRDELMEIRELLARARSELP